MINLESGLLTDVSNLFYFGREKKRAFKGASCQPTFLESIFCFGGALKEKIQKAASLLRKLKASKSSIQRELMAQLLEEYDVNPAACIVFKKDEEHDATIEMNAAAFQSLQQQSGYIHGLWEEQIREKRRSIYDSSKE